MGQSADSDQDNYSFCSLVFSVYVHSQTSGVEYIGALLKISSDDIKYSGRVVCERDKKITVRSKVLGCKECLESQGTLEIASSNLEDFGFVAVRAVNGDFFVLDLIVRGLSRKEGNQTDILL